MPQNPSNARPLNLEWLTAQEREDFEERAAIKQFDGNLPQAIAEAQAFSETICARWKQKRP